MTFLDCNEDIDNSSCVGFTKQRTQIRPYITVCRPTALLISSIYALHLPQSALKCMRSLHGSLCYAKEAAADVGYTGLASKCFNAQKITKTQVGWDHESCCLHC